MHTLEIWEEDNCITFVSPENRDKVQLAEDAVLLTVITAEDYNSAMQKCYKYLEWEDYSVQQC